MKKFVSLLPLFAVLLAAVSCVVVKKGRRQKINVEKKYLDYSAVDRRAIDSPPECENDIRTLGAYLTEGETDDFNKIRAFYIWITTHIGYNSGYNTDIGRGAANSTLRNRKGVCAGIASLFKCLCEDSGIKAYVVTGRAGGGMHAWSAVNIDDKFYYLDATWGMKPELREKFFLINPSTMLMTHKVDNYEWKNRLKNYMP